MWKNAAFRRLPEGRLGQPFYGWFSFAINSEAASAAFSLFSKRKAVKTAYAEFLAERYQP